MSDWEVVGPASDWEVETENPETPEETALRESFLNKKKFKPSPIHRKFVNTGPDVPAQLRAEREAAAEHDVSPSQALAAGFNNAADAYTLGAWGGLNRAAGDPFGAAAGMDRFRREAPIAAATGAAPALLAEGPLQVLAGGIGRGLESAAENPIIGGALGRGARSLLTGIGTAGVIGGLNAASQGASPKEALKAGGENAALGAVTGLPLTIGAQGLGALGRAIQNSRGGQAREFLESHGATVGPGGVDLPGAYITRGASDADIGAQAEASANRGLEMLNEQRRAEVSIPYRRELARIHGEAEAVPEPVIEGNETERIPEESMRHMIGETPEPEVLESRPPTAEEATYADRRLRPTVQIPVQSMAEMTANEVQPSDIVSETPAPGALRDVRPIYSKLVEAYYDPSTDPAVAAKIKHVLTVMDERYTRPDGSILMTEEHLNGLRQQLQRTAKSGISTDERLNPLQQAASVARGMVEEGPYAEANQAYAEGSKRFRESRRLLGINERPKTLDESQAAVSKVKNLITRRGQNTVTAGGQEGRLAEFEARHPQIAEEFIKPEMLRRRADISFSALPKRHGGLTERLGSFVGAGALGEAALNMLGHGHVSVPHALGTLAAGLTVQNLPAIQARLLYGPALAAQAAEPLFLQDIPLLQAARTAHGEERR